MSGASTCVPKLFSDDGKRHALPSHVEAPASSLGELNLLLWR
jgi:hypothetical protein